MTDDAIEAVARALWDLQRNGRFMSWDCYNAPWQDEYRARARAAFAAYQPPVEEMIRQEREACAQVADEWENPRIGEAIRERLNPSY